MNTVDAYVEDLPLWRDGAAKELLEALCAKHGVPVEVVTELVVMQRERQYQERAHGIYERITEILSQFE